MNNNNAAVELVHVVNPSGGSGESYTAGSGITISDQNEIGIDQSVVATKAYVTQEIGTVREVPEASSADSGKVLGVTDSEGTLGWVANGGGSSYTAGTGIDITNDTISVDTTVIATQNDISGLQGALTAGTGIDITNDTISVDTTVVATQTDLSGIEQVPTVTSSDDGKVLTATYSGGTGSFAWATAQGGSTYTAGDGIDISAQDEISVKAGDGLSVADVTSVLHSFDTPSSKVAGYTVYTICPLTSDILSKINSSDGFTFTLTRDFKDATYSGQNIYAGIGVYDASNYGAVTDMALMGSALTPTYDGMNYWLESGTSITMKWSELVSEYSNLDLATIQSDISNYCIAIITYSSGSSMFEYARTSASASDDETATTVTATDVLKVSNPVPSITGNAGKVLKVNAGGTATEWATESAGTTYSAGNMISLANNAVAVSTTAGITDIQLVNALPASPVATVLYLIPET